MLDEVIESGADVDVETGIKYESVEHLMDEANNLSCDGVVNCTGLGSSGLCDDREMIGARGVLHHYDRQNCIRRTSVSEGEFGPMLHDANILVEDAPWGSAERPCYLIVRANTIVVGGSYLEGDTEPNLRPEEHEQLLKNAELLGIDTQLSKLIGNWTGFRPYRPISRCEIDDNYGGPTGAKQNHIRLVHSYGYGGSGWTVYVGCAKEATRLLLELPSS